MEIAGRLLLAAGITLALLGLLFLLVAKLGIGFAEGPAPQGISAPTRANLSIQHAGREAVNVSGMSIRIVEWFPPLFHDRAAAGRELADALAGRRLEQPVVVGIARGGVAVAVEVARALGAPLTAVDVERVNAAGARLGGTTAEGPPYLRDGHGVADELVEEALARARRAARALEARLEHERLPVAGRTAIVVDDGLVTGLTLAAACRWARAEGVAMLVASTPVGHVDGLARVRGEADEVVCPHPLEQIAVVGQAYELFDPLDEWYVASLLADFDSG